MADTVVTLLLTAILEMKRMYDQHRGNADEMKDVQRFLEDLIEQIPALSRRFRECDGNNLGGAAMKNLERDISNVTNKLVKYARHGTFFSIFTSRERMEELQKLHRTVMASIQKNVGIATLSMLLDVRTSQVDMQGALMRSTSELKSLLTTSMAQMSREVAREVRAEVVQASRTPFVENEKFWADVLAAVDRGVTELSPSANSMDRNLLDDSDDQFQEEPGQSYQLYKDPITDNLFIDPVMTSNGETYDRWTIIDNNMTKNPFNPSAALHILGDNISVRRALFYDFPEQEEKYRQRRYDYRSRALDLAKQGLIADAVLALQYVLQWNNGDTECREALARAKVALKDARQEVEEPPPPQPIKPEPIIGPAPPSPDEPPYIGEDEPKSPVSNADRFEIYDADRYSPSAPAMPQTPESLRPMKDIRTIPRAHSGSWVESVTYSPDGTRIATTGFDKMAKIWDAEGGRVLCTLRGHTFLVRSSAWSPAGNGLLVTGSYDHTCKVWDTKTGEILYTLQGHKDNVNSVAWDPTGRTIATGSKDGTAILWDVKSRVAIFATPAEPSLGPVSSVSWNHEGLFLAVAYKLKSIRIWDVTQKKIVFELKCEDTGNFNHVAFSPKGSAFAAASSNHSTVVCDAVSGKYDVKHTLIGHSDEVMHVAWSPDGTKLATGSKDKSARIWNALTGNTMFSLQRHNTALSSVAWRPDGVGVATSSEGGSVRLWECEAKPSSRKLCKLLSFRSSRTIVE